VAVLEFASSILNFGNNYYVNICWQQLAACSRRHTAFLIAATTESSRLECVHSILNFGTTKWCTKVEVFQVTCCGSSMGAEMTPLSGILTWWQDLAVCRLGRGWFSQGNLQQLPRSTWFCNPQALHCTARRTQEESHLLLFVKRVLLTLASAAISTQQAGAHPVHWRNNWEQHQASQGRCFAALAQENPPSKNCSSCPAGEEK